VVKITTRFFAHKQRPVSALQDRDSGEKLARQVSAETGESLMETIIHALEERLERLEARQTTKMLLKRS
jgi:hypothetical protein